MEPIKKRFLKGDMIVDLGIYYLSESIGDEEIEDDELYDDDYVDWESAGIVGFID